MLASAHQAAQTLSGADIFWITIIVLGLLSWLGERYRRVRLGMREAGELRHRRRLELAMARSPYSRGRVYRRPGDLAEDEFAVPAAVIPLPPSAYPLNHAPGACRHEKILPVITGDGEHVRWLCANPRCDAEFPAGVAVYEEPENA